MARAGHRRGGGGRGNATRRARAPWSRKESAAPPAEARASERLRRWLAVGWKAARDAAAVDLRALAIFRVAFGVVLLLDLASRLRSPDLVAFYTDDGVLPLASAQAIGVLRPTLFALAASKVVAEWLFAAIGVVYVAYTLGAATRAMQVLVVVACVSLDARYPLLQDAGSDVVHALALWTMLLPLGARFSLDAWRRGGPAPRGSAVSVATVGLLLNLALIYLLAGVQQTGAAWHDGTAFHDLLWSNRYATALGGALRQHEPAWLSPVFTYAMRGVECLLPLLVLSPALRERARSVAFASMVVFQVGLALLVVLGALPWAMIALSTLLLGPRACRRLEVRIGRAVRRVAGLASRAGARAPRSRARVIRSPAISRAVHRVLTGVREAWGAAVLLLVVVGVSTGNDVVPEGLRLTRLARLVDPVVETLGLHQSWGLFAPDPPLREATLLVDARLADGTHLDPLTGKTPDLHAPEHGPYLDDARWLEVRRQILEGRSAPYRLGLWEYVLRTDVREGLGANKRVVAFKAYRVAGTPPPPGSTEYTRVSAEEFHSWPAVHRSTAPRDLTDPGGP